METEVEWRRGPGNGYGYTCGCGRAVAVSTALCGSPARCECGAETRVPSLSRLRELTGRDPYEAGLMDEIRRLIRDGRLPSSGVCALSGRPTEDTVLLSVLIPRFFQDQSHRGMGKALLMTWLLGWLGFMLYQVSKKPQIEEEGAESLEIPLRLAADQAPRARELSQRRLRKLLRTEPLYARLLQENPHSRITVLG
ncbi:hypothetical protein [Paludisphaera soli]|uniref:hypothetical protein n=1 Tax=Paludisphaera soli TaxID=2712865 RepID=UPI0013EDF96A|nr:hypothetical protein [Paludisphaera soli]